MKAKFTLPLIVLLFITTQKIYSQNTFPSTGSAGIGTTTPDASSLLEINSASKGLLIPRMTAAQRNVIASPATGLMIFQTNNTPGFYYYNGNAWVAVSSKGPNKFLSNLSAPTAVNVDILPGIDNTVNMGSSTLRWKDVNLYNLKFADGTIQTSAAKFYTAGTGISISGTTISATGSSSQWTTNGSNIYNTNSGYVGIGISTPTLGGLVVNTKAGAVNAMFGSNATGVAIESANPGVGLNTYYNNGRKFISAGYGGLISMDPASGLFAFYNSASSGAAAGSAALTADLAITASGNVGIGTTTPTAGGLVVNTKAGGVNGMFGSNTTGVALESANPGIGLNTYYNNGRKFIAAGYGGVIGLDPTSGLLGFYNSPASGSANAAATTPADMVLTASGNIGIGTTTPTTGGLVVNTKVGAVNAMFGSNTTGVAIESANPGIGLNTYYNNGRKFIAAGYGAVIGLDPASGLLTFYNSAASGAADGGATLTPDLVITANGNVGIGGITNPDAKLQVLGSAVINGVTVGTDSHNSNTVVGYNALENNSASGGYNSAVGSQSLYSNTTGYSNTAMGDQSLFSNSIGNNNTGYGTSALYSNTAGNENTAIGDGALGENTTGSDNTVLGYNAFGFNKTGLQNTIIGSSSGVNSANTNFSNSSILGYGVEVNASNKVVIGNTSVTVIGGTVGWSNLSDGRFKKDIQQNVPGLSFINKLKPVTYHLDLEKFEQFSGRKDSMLNAMKPELQKAEQTLRTGFVAQDVEQTAKEINYDFDGVNHPKNDKDNYSLVYADFVPSLVKGVQELSKQNDSLKNQNQQLNARLDKIEAMLTSQNNPSSVSTLNKQTIELSSDASLSQNIPNPFSNSTIINYNLPVNKGNAYINFYNVNGSVLKSLKLEGNGKGTVTLKAGELASGTYSYALLIDGKMISSKQMLLIK